MTNELLANRYRTIKTLGSGGMGIVWLVEDTRRDNKIMALKTMKGSPHEADAENFRAEFRSIIGVVHPNIPQVYDFGVLPPPESSLFFTSEFVEGKALDQLTDKWSPPQLHAVLVQVCRALAFLHSRGMLHRDLKPENVLGMMNEYGEIEQLKLVDFGLATKGSQETETGGTIDYMAPEIIGGKPASAASDIYALGMMLYRLATGRMPFSGADPLAIAQQRTNEEAPPPLRFRPDLPVGLSDVISALIRIKPRERPLSARHAIALLNEREGTEYPYETEVTSLAYIRSASAVTNMQEREELIAREEALLLGEKPRHVVVVSPPGLGRKRLLRDFAQKLSVQGIVVRTLEEEADLVGGREQALIVPKTEHLPALKLYSTIAASVDEGAWCVIGTMRLDERLSALISPHDFLTLRPLDEDGVRSFIEATFPENSFPENFAQRLYSNTLGFASALSSAIDSLQRDDILRIGLKGWELLPGMWRLPVHPVVADHIEQVLIHLSDEARHLAYHLACSRTPLPPEVLLFVSEGDHRGWVDLEETLDQLHRVSWISRQDDEFCIVFSAISDYLESMLDSDTAAEIHSRLANAWAQPTLAEHPKQRREQLTHDILAGAWTIPPANAAQTLIGMLEDGDLRRLRQLVEVGLESDPPDDLKTVLLDVLVRIEYFEGNLESAANLLGRMLNGGDAEVLDDNLDRMARYAMIEEKLGNTEHAESILRRCFEVFPAGHDSRAGVVFGTLAWISFKGGEAERAQQLAEEGLLRIPPQAVDPGYAMLLNTVATLAFYRGEVDAATMYWRRGLEVNETLHDRKGTANIYNNLGVLAAQSGDRFKARSLWKKCAEIAGEINDVHRLAGIYNNLGVDSLETGALPEAEEYYLKALGLFRRMKSPREQVEILSNLGELSFYRADFPRAHAYLQEAVTLASMLEDFECEIEPLIYLGKLLLTLEELEGAAAVMERAYRAANEVGVKKGQVQAWEGIAQLRARRGRWDGATEALNRARMLLSDDVDPLARQHFLLTECAISSERGDLEKAKDALAAARQAAETKWDPFTAARTLVYGLLFAQEELDARERSRVIRQLSVYPDLLWRFHWASARGMIAQGAVRKALEEFGRGANVLKAIASRLSERSRELYLSAPQIKRFKEEAVGLRNSLKES